MNDDMGSLYEDLQARVRELEKQLRNAKQAERLRIYKWLDSLRLIEVSLPWLKTQILHMDEE